MTRNLKEDQSEGKSGLRSLSAHLCSETGPLVHQSGNVFSGEFLPRLRVGIKHNVLDVGAGEAGRGQQNQECGTAEWESWIVITSAIVCDFIVGQLCKLRRIFNRRYALVIFSAIA